MVRKALLLAAVLLGPAAAGAQVRSAYGCQGLATAPQVASVEGRDGVFYRLIPDLQMAHPFTTETVADVARLSRALEAAGTRLIYVPVPTKSLGMPQYLPAEAADYGYDPDVAATVYEDMIARLQDAGVAAVNLRRAFRSLGPDGRPYFGTDPRLTADGARAASRAIASAIETSLGPDRGGRKTFVSVPTGVQDLDSHHRVLLQRHCLATLPPVRTRAFRTSVVDDAGGDGAGAIFGTQTGMGRLALVGTGITAPRVVNFAGFLSEFTGMGVVQFSLPGGGAYGAITSYMTSPRFSEDPPAVLIWENPVQNNLAQFGDQPLRELTAAASGGCRIPLALDVKGEGQRLMADLTALDQRQAHTLFLDADSAGIDWVVFRFRTDKGRSRSRPVVRQAGQVLTGRFYVPLDGLWTVPATDVEIDLPAPAGTGVALYACPVSAGG